MPRKKKATVPHPFQFKDKPHCRTHGPRGHKDYRAYKQWLRDEFEFRCVYCLTRELWAAEGQNRFSIDHVKPKSTHKKLTCDYDNLVYACGRCNTLKAAISGLPDPCQTSLKQHLKLLPNGMFKGLTPEGQRLVGHLDLNDEDRVRDRSMQLYLYDTQKTVAEYILSRFGYPSELPDLSKFKPPKGNSRPDGLKTSHYVRRQQKKLGPYY
jgi:hypothetical protein